MATTTPNFGWAVPTSTDLVKDGAVAIETLGDSIDASLVDLKGGTTGQVLAKASGTDMDFTWTAIDPLVILDAKGDLITATAADTPARLAVGTNGQTLVADSTAATGLKWATASSGLTLISSSSFSGVSSQSFNSVFSSTYLNYKVVLRIHHETTNASDLRFRYRDAGTDVTTGYRSALYELSDVGTLAATTGATTYVDMGDLQGSSIARSGYDITLYGPFAGNSRQPFSYTGWSGTTKIYWGGGDNLTSTASDYDGFTLYTPTGNIAGEIRIYGLAN